MKTTRINMYHNLFMFFLAIFLTGCYIAPSAPKILATDLHEGKSVATTPTAISTITSTTILLPSETPFLTVTATPSVTAAQLPTIPADEAQAYVIHLIATNNGCQLPCWWGIHPGKTTWEEARNFLESFGAGIIALQGNVYGVGYENLPKNISDGAVGASITVKDGVVQTISTDVFYPLSEVLQVYKQPDEVWIHVDRQSINPKAPFTIALYYSGKGFLATYHGTAEKQEILKVCPDAIHDRQTVWFLWSPSLKLSFEEVGQKSLLFFAPSDNRFHKLEDVTSMNIQQFYDIYKNSENSFNCLEMQDSEQR